MSEGMSWEEFFELLKSDNLPEPSQISQIPNDPTGRQAGKEAEAQVSHFKFLSEEFAKKVEELEGLLPIAKTRAGRLRLRSEKAASIQKDQLEKFEKLRESDVTSGSFERVMNRVAR
jgi:hypothetical protein